MNGYVSKKDLETDFIPCLGPWESIHLKRAKTSYVTR